MKRTALPRPATRLAGTLLLAVGLAMAIGCSQFAGIGPDDCATAEVQVTGADARHQSRYTFDCDHGIAGQVSTAFDAAAHQGREKPSDAGTVVTNEGTPTVPPSPAGAETISEAQRHILGTQIQDALKALVPASLPSAAERLRDHLDTATTAKTQLLPQTPAGFSGERDSSRIVLRWTDTSNETYYSLTASNARSGQTFTLPAPAPKLGTNSTMYIDDVLGPTQTGGAEYHLQACNAIGCSAPAKVVVP
jgi:hypothetical protein